jgi:hypothetical protein
MLPSGRSGSAGALPLGDPVAQSRSPALADIIGARRVHTAVMISSGFLGGRSTWCRVGVPELTLDGVERDTLAGELERVGMAQLVRREATPDACARGQPAKLGADRGARPRSPARGPVDDEKGCPTGSSACALSHGRSCSQPHSSDPDFAAEFALAATDDQGAAAVIQFSLGQRERFLDS